MWREIGYKEPEIVMGLSQNGVTVYGKGYLLCAITKTSAPSGRQARFAPTCSSFAQQIG